MDSNPSSSIPYEFHQQLSAYEEIKAEFSDRFNRIFQFYCLYGEPLNTCKLKSSKFLKLLRDANILSKGVLRVGGPTKSQENINLSNRGKV